MSTQNETFWTPEAEGFPGLYANESEPMRGKIEDPTSRAISTRNIHAAKRFATREECEAWCIANPVPYFEPREHEILGEP